MLEAARTTGLDTLMSEGLDLSEGKPVRGTFVWGDVKPYPTKPLLAHTLVLDGDDDWRHEPAAEFIDTVREFDAKDGYYARKCGDAA